MSEEKVNVRAIRDEIVRLMRRSLVLDHAFRDQMISDQTQTLAPDLVSPKAARILEKWLEFLRDLEKIERQAGEDVERKIQQIREKVASYVTDKDMIELLTAEVAIKIALKKIDKEGKEEQKS